MLSFRVASIMCSSLPVLPMSETRGRRDPAPRGSTRYDTPSMAPRQQGP